jgi:hypothetical protein
MGEDKDGAAHQAGLCDGAALASAALAALLPWSYLAALGSGLPDPLRVTNAFFVLPGVALLGVAGACLRRAPRDGYVHVAALGLGSLALFAGATWPGTYDKTRLLLAGTWGGLVAALAGGAATIALPALRRVLALDMAVLAGAASAPLLAVTLFWWPPERPLASAGAYCVVALAWTLTAWAGRRPALLYPASVGALLATRVAAIALANWGERYLQWEPNETRWLLACVPLFAYAWLRVARTVGARAVCAPLVPRGHRRPALGRRVAGVAWGR